MLVSHLVLLLASLLACSAGNEGTVILSVPKDNNIWVRAIPSGKPVWPRWVKPVVGLDDKLWMIDEKLAWNSADGINWTSTIHDGPDAVKPGAVTVFFKNRFWLMGGMKTWAEFTNDVWSSSDGLKWELVTRKAPWHPRRNHSVVLFAGKLWLIGGQKSSGRVDATPTEFFNDVWNSPDGLNWTRVTNQTPWTMGQAIVFKDQLWFLGQGGSWSSLDGNHWKAEAKNVACLNRSGHGLLTFAGKLWLFGGKPNDRMTNDVWSSSDAVEWIQEQQAPWFPRGGEYSTTFKNKLWIYGGKTGVDYKRADDVWFMK